MGTRTRYKDEISMLTEKINTLENEKKHRDDVYVSDFDTIRDNLKVLEDENNKLKNEIKSLDSRKLTLIKDTETRYIKKIEQMEIETEEIREKCQRDIAECQLKSETDLRQMKVTYDDSRQR